jgi:hypothetical protein
MRVHTGKSYMTPAMAAVAILVVLLLGGCSVLRPAPAPVETAAPAGTSAGGEAPGTDQPAAYTQAAQTIIAELTLNPPAATQLAPGAQAKPSSTPTEEPLPATSTPKPTNTPLPSDTPLPTNTPLPTSTASPAVPPTATLPPEPSWRLVATDDFSYGFWPKDGGESARFRYTMGGYSILNRSPDVIVWSTRSDQFAVARLEVTGKRIAGPMDGYYGIVCNFANGGNYYFLGVGPDGWYGIGLQSSNKLTWLIEGIDTTGVVLTGAAPNVVRADCYKGSLTLWVNGTMMATTRDNTFSAGSIGMGVGNRATAGTEVLFDDFSVYQVEETNP